MLTKVKGVVLANSVDTVADLATANKGSAIQVLGFHTKGDGGGGVFYWDATKDKSKHDGYDIIDPLKANLLTTDKLSYLTPSTTGLGCWVSETPRVLNIQPACAEKSPAFIKTGYWEPLAKLENGDSINTTFVATDLVWGKSDQMVVVQGRFKVQRPSSGTASALQVFGIPFTQVAGARLGINITSSVLGTAVLLNSVTTTEKQHCGVVAFGMSGIRLVNTLQTTNAFVSIGSTIEYEINLSIQFPLKQGL